MAIGIFQMPMMGSKMEFPSNIILGSVLTLIPFALNAVRKIYDKYFRDTPSTLHPLYEYSDPHFYGMANPITNRDHVIRDILTAWKHRITPILVGKSGVGKT